MIENGGSVKLNSKVSYECNISAPLLRIRNSLNLTNYALRSDTRWPRRRRPQSSLYTNIYPKKKLVKD